MSNQWQLRNGTYVSHQPNEWFLFCFVFCFLFQKIKMKKEKGNCHWYYKPNFVHFFLGGFLSCYMSWEPLHLPTALGRRGESPLWVGEEIKFAQGHTARRTRQAGRGSSWLTPSVVLLVTSSSCEPQHLPSMNSPWDQPPTLTCSVKWHEGDGRSARSVQLTESTI